MTGPAEEILKKGFVDVKVYVSGLRQAHRLELQQVKTAQGILPVLNAKHYIPTAELVKLSEALGLPIKHKTTLVFPKGTMAAKFVQLLKETPIPEPQEIGTAEADVIEAELEE